MNSQIKNDNNPDEFSIYFLNPGDHPVNEETRKYKIQLLIYSSLAIIFSVMGNSKIEMILGIKFTPAIQAIWVVPLLVILIFYHLYMFNVTYDSSSKAWTLKKEKLREKDVKQNSPYEDKDKYVFSVFENINASTKISSLIEDYEIMANDFLNTRTTLCTDEIEKKVSALGLNKTDKAFSIAEASLASFESYNRNLELVFKKASDKIDEVNKYIDRIKSSPVEEVKLITPMRELLPNELVSLKDYFDNYKKHNFDVVKKSHELYDLFEVIMGKTVELSSGNRELTRRLEEIETRVNSEMCSLIHELDEVSFKETFWTKNLPYYYFPTFFSFFSIFVSFIYIGCAIITYKLNQLFNLTLPWFSP